MQRLTLIKAQFKQPFFHLANT